MGRPFRGRVLVVPAFDPSNLNVDRPVERLRQQPADPDHQRLRGDHLLPPQRQPLPPRLADRARAAELDRPDDPNNVTAAGTASPTPSFARRLRRQRGGELAGRQRPLGPAGFLGARTGSGFSQIMLNCLGDLTNRENRLRLPALLPTTISPTHEHDRARRDRRRLQPRRRPRLLSDPVSTTAAGAFSARPPETALRPGLRLCRTGGGFSSMAFPYIFPGAYTQPETDSSTRAYRLDPLADRPIRPVPGHRRSRPTRCSTSNGSTTIRWISATTFIVRSPPAGRSRRGGAFRPPARPSRSAGPTRRGSSISTAGSNRRG